MQLLARIIFHVGLLGLGGNQPDYSYQSKEGVTEDCDLEG
jgi:hypothetical protein